MLGIHSVYSRIETDTRTNGHLGLFHLFLLWNKVNQTHTKLDYDFQLLTNSIKLCQAKRSNIQYLYIYSIQSLFIQFNPHLFNLISISIQFNLHSFNLISVFIQFNPYLFNLIFTFVQFNFYIHSIQAGFIQCNFYIYSIQFLYSFNLILIYSI